MSKTLSPENFNGHLIALVIHALLRQPGISREKFTADLLSETARLTPKLVAQMERFLMETGIRNIDSHPQPSDLPHSGDPPAE